MILELILIAFIEIAACPFLQLFQKLALLLGRENQILEFHPWEGGARCFEELEAILDVVRGR
jgi:hypothetical protein